MKILNKSDFKKLEEKASYTYFTKTNINFEYMRKTFEKYAVENEEEFDAFYIVFESEKENAEFRKDLDRVSDLRRLESQLKDAPAGVFEVIKNWDIINKSPFSSSFYNTYDIDWGSKPEGSLRISDHWNFESKGETHCVLESTKEYLENTWILARYENGIYKELARF